MVVRRDERGDDDGSLRRDGFDVLERHVADQLGLGELAERGEPLTEVPRGAAGELLHPAHAEPERLAQDAVVVGVVLVAAEVDAPTRSAGSSAAGATRGAVSASTIGLRARTSSSLKPSCRASTSTRSATDAPVIRLRPVSVSMPIRISCACSARRIARLRCSNAMSWRLVSSASAGTASRSASTRSSRFSAKRGQRGAEPADAPRAPQAVRGRNRIELLENAVLGRDLAGEPEVDGDVAVDRDHDLARVDLGASSRRPRAPPPRARASRSGGTQRSCSSSMRGSGKVSATGPGP